ncbi:MAG: sorbosone dehydrogenase [Planctomycetaceae bacterium]|nr:sorbosone dehydrogenase [Planctomycetaceae bacterium]
MSASSLFGQRDLQNIPDPDPAVSLASFALPEGMEAKLFAGDGQIAKPIHMNFDARGRLWVAGSEVYPQIEPGQSATDKVFILEDKDQDGVAEHVIVFADDLLVPTGILPDENGGCYVANSTELLYLWDSDGDGKADQRRIVLSGFGTEDTHHLLHTLNWAPDGSMFMNQSIYIHSHVETPWGVRHMNGGGIWRFRPDSVELEVHCLGFVNPWGTIFDRWGQSFATDGAYGEGINYVFPNSVFVTSPGATRIVGGMNPGSPKHCGLEMISGRHFPTEWQGNMIANDFRANRVCRFEVEPQGSSYRSRQLEEVIRSTHQAFRPIDAKMGADGALYIADWYNPIIQHGEVDFRDPRRDKQRGRVWRLSFPARELVKRPDLTTMNPTELLEQLRAPEQSTRTWAKRFLRRHPKSDVLEAISKAIRTTQQAMPSPVDERYAMEQQYLLELLWAGLHLDHLDRELHRELLSSQDGRIRAAAVRVASDFLHRADRAELVQVLAKAIQDEHPQVRLEAVVGLRRVPESGSATIALRALERPVDASLDFALWKTLRDLGPTWVPLAENGQFDFGGNPDSLTFALKTVDSTDVVQPLLKLLNAESLKGDAANSVIRQIALTANSEQLDQLLQWIERQPEANQLPWVLIVGTEGKAVPSARPKLLAEQIEKLIRDGDALPLDTTTQLLRTAAKWKDPATDSFLWQLATQVGESQAPVSEAAVRAWAEMLVGIDPESRRQGAEQFLKQAETWSPGTARRRLWVGQIARWDVESAVPLIAAELMSSETGHLSQLLTNIFEQKGGQEALATHLASAGIQLTPDVAREVIRLQRASPAPQESLATILRKVGQLSEAGWKFSAEEQVKFLQRIAAEGDPVAGELVYRRNDLQCMNCHAIGGVGSTVGPDMISIGASAPVDYLLDSLLNPSSKVKEGYHSKKILTVDGLIVTGIVQSHSGGVYRLRLADGSFKSIAETEIEEIADGSSLMPAGLCDSLTAKELIDLTSFLSNLGRTDRFSIRSDRFARAWQVLGWDQPTHHLLNRTSFDSVTDGQASLPWQPLYPLVSGGLLMQELPTYKIHANVPPTTFLKTLIQVNEAGRMELRVSDAKGLQLWIQGKPTPVTGNTIIIERPIGECEVILAVDRQVVAPELSLEVMATENGSAVFKLPLSFQ